MVWFKRISHLLLALMFLAFAALQYNDPDPLLWIFIYGAMTVVCTLAVFEIYALKFMLALAAGYIIYLVILFPGVKDWLASPDRSLLFDDLAKMQYPYIEESREFLGLVICLVVLVVYFFLAKKKN
jgi:hypothetical protein